MFVTYTHWFPNGLLQVSSPKPCRCLSYFLTYYMPHSFLRLSTKSWFAWSRFHEACPYEIFPIVLFLGST